MTHAQVKERIVRYLSDGPKSTRKIYNFVQSCCMRRLFTILDAMTRQGIVSRTSLNPPGGMATESFLYRLN